MNKTADGVTRKIPVTFKPGEGVKQVPQGLAPALSSRYLAASIGQLLMGFLGGWVGPSVFDLGWALFKRS